MLSSIVMRSSALFYAVGGKQGGSCQGLTLCEIFENFEDKSLMRNNVKIGLVFQRMDFFTFGIPGACTALFVAFGFRINRNSWLLEHGADGIGC